MRLSMRTLGIVVTLTCVLAASAQAQRVRDPEAEAAYQSGLEQLGQENWEAALEAFSKAAQMDETDAEALTGRGDALRGMEDYSNAQQSYMGALIIDDQSARAHYGQGICFREMGDINNAFASFRNAVDIDRNDPEITADLGAMLINHNVDIASGLRFLDKAIELNPDNAIALMNRARAHAVLGEPEEAIADLVKSVEIDPNAYDTYDTLARVHLNEEEFEKAIAAFNQAIEHYQPEEKSDPSIYVNGYLEIARTKLRLAVKEDTPQLTREELYKEVLEDAEKVLTEFPDHMPETGFALHRKGQALRLQKRYGEAIKAYTEAIQLVPGGRDAPYIADAYLKKGICWHYQGQDSLARSDFEFSGSIRFEDPLPHLWMGYSYAQEEDYWQAITNYGNAIAKSPNFSLAYVNRGLAYMQLGEFNKAVDNFNEAIRNEPTVAKHYYKRGVAHLKLEEFQKALDSFDHATRFDDEYVKAHRGAVVALRALGREELADKQEERIQELQQ